MIHSLFRLLKDTNDIIDTCSVDQMSFEQAYVITRFYYDYQDTNAIIDEAERMATEDAGRLREFALSLKEETAALLNNIERPDGVDFRAIAQAHSKQYYSIFQEASEQLNPYWKRYSELNNPLTISLSVQRIIPKSRRNVRRLRLNTIHGRLRSRDFMPNMRKKTGEPDMSFPSKPHTCMPLQQK